MLFDIVRQSILLNLMKLKTLFSLLGLVALLLTGSAIVVVTSGGKHTKKIVRVSSFKNTESLVLATQVRLLEAFNESKLLLVGTESASVVQSWVNVLKSRPDLPQFAFVGSHESFGALEGVQPLAKDRILAGIEDALRSANGRILLFLPTPEVLRKSTQSIAGSIQQPFTTFIHTGFPKSRELESRLIWKCQTSNLMEDPLSELGCLILQTARRDYRRVKNEQGPILGIVEQFGDFDYLVLQDNLIL